MKPQHADPEEAATTARECGAKHALGFHWGTFHFWDESIDEPGKRFSAALSTPESKPLGGNLLHQELQGIASNHMTMLSRSPNSIPVSTKILDETASTRSFRTLIALAFWKQSAKAFTPGDNSHYGVTGADARPWVKL
jgi:hypothetical protein